MNNSGEIGKKELAERLWDQQGKREDHATGNWLESEYRSHPPIAAVQDEIDLRMRGLGPLTTRDKVDTHTPAPTQLESEAFAAGSIAMAVGVVVGLGVSFWVLRKLLAGRQRGRGGHHA